MVREIIQPKSVHSTAGVGYSHVAKAGDTVYCQYWSRDPAAPFTTGLTDGVEFSICP